MFSEWAIFQYELNQHTIEFTEQYHAEGVIVSARLQRHQIVPLAEKIQHVTRGRETLKVMDEQND